MGRRVDEPVGRHDAILAPSADPVATHVAVAYQVEELDAAFPGHQEPLGRLLTVAAVVVAGRPEAVEADVLFARLACAEVESGLEPRAVPDKAVGHEYVDGGLEARRARVLPELLARGFVEGGELLPGRPQDDALMHHERRDRPAGATLGAGVARLG